MLARARKGDMKAHEIIYRTFSPPVYSLMARMTGSTHTADDLLQETFVEVIRSIGKFRGEASLATWIRKIAVSKCLMHMRSAWQNRATLFRDLGEDHLPYEPAVACGTPLTHAQMDLEKALARLSDTSRVVVILHDVEGYTHQEIAELMGNSVSFSKSQLARAHARLQQAARASIGAAEESGGAER
ncbi:MAG: RNA polymerase sigma factor [Gammaproteobacteria bacterium]|nr:RNA polymerase sigma factor [Gammaproteobacteria bacterium]